MSLIHRVKSMPAAFVTVFLMGVLCSEALHLALSEQVGSGEFPLLVLFLAAVGFFSVFAALFVLRARQEMQDESACISSGVDKSLEQANAKIDECLGQARGDFRQELTCAREELSGSIASAQQIFLRRLDVGWEDVRAGIDSVRKECRIVSEPDFERREPSLCYEALVPLIRRARKSIFVIPNPYSEGKLDTWELPPRQGYLKAIEDRVLEMRSDPGFEYLRVQQVPDLKGDLPAHIGRSAAEHMLRLHRQLAGVNGARERVRFRVIEQDQISGQMIVDGETLIKFLSGVDQHGKKRLVAITVMRDPTSTAIPEYYERMRSNLLDSAARLDFADLERRLS